MARNGQRAKWPKEEGRGWVGWAGRSSGSAYKELCFAPFVLRVVTFAVVLGWLRAGLAPFAVLLVGLVLIRDSVVKGQRTRAGASGSSGAA